MIVGVPRESYPGERRVAIVPAVLPALLKGGMEVVVEAGAGMEAGYPDATYIAKGAKIVADRAEVFRAADVVTQVLCYGSNDKTGDADLPLLRRDQVLVGFLRPLGGLSTIQQIAERGVTGFSVELMPRTTRAQSMDVLSSQANIAGYKAVLMAANAYQRLMPMMMTAAGTIKAARVLVMGAGVAGLQAIATARRLGAIVSATDVRAAAKEQVESLGASFITVDEEAARSAETAGGYAREMGEDYQRRQRELVAQTLRRTDIVICTALVPGRRAPVLLTEAMVAGMAPGSIIVDLAVESGGNVEGSQPGAIAITANGVKIIGHNNMPSRIAADASQLYARNLLAFLALLVDKEGKLRIDTSDEIVKAALLTLDGAVVNPALAPEPAAAAAPGATS